MKGGPVSGDTADGWRSAQAGGRRLVCVSGLDGAAIEWAGVRPTLARHGELIAVELTLRAAGGTHARGAPLKVAAEALHRTLASGPEQSVLIGHSMGAVVSMLSASAKPQRLAGLVLTAPFLPVARNGRSTLATAADYAGHRALFVAGARRRRRSRRPAVDSCTRAAALRALAHYGLRPADFHAMADRIACPVLLVHGDRDHYVPPSSALAAAARHPAWQLAVIAGAGHFPHRDTSAAWLTSVDPWLQRLHAP